jgi:excisionase family DNA binding protein
MVDYSKLATVTPEQVAQRWGVSAKTVRAMLCSGTLKGFKTGTRGPKSQWRILVSEVERYERGGK